MATLEISGPKKAWYWDHSTIPVLFLPIPTSYHNGATGISITVTATQGTDGISSVRVRAEGFLSDAPAAVPEPTAMTPTLRPTEFPAAKTRTMFVPISTRAPMQVPSVSSENSL